MPGNNRKPLNDAMLLKIEAIYSFEYIPANNTIVTHLSTSAKKTIHSAEHSFIIIVPKLNRKKVLFTLDAINIWKEFQLDKALSKYSLIAVNNAVNKLKIMYQQPNHANVVDMLKNNFNGIAKI